MLQIPRRALAHVSRQLPHTTIRLFSNSPAFKMKEKSIVSSFICTPPESEGGLKFALFKRSTNVSTYKQKWAVCSGSIEKTDPTPEFAARREIEEETQLTSDDITLYRTGKAFKLIDTDLDITWIIHTFSFLLDDPNKKLVIEGEHTEYKFIRPAELENEDHVPALEEGMRRVLPGPSITKGLDALRDDHDNGAEVLAISALQTLKEAINSVDLASAKTPEDFWKELRLAAWTLAKNGRPDMGPAIEGALSKALLAITEAIDKRGGSCFTEHGLNRLGVEHIREAAMDGINETIAARETRMYALSVAFVDHITSSEAYQWRKGGENPLNILTLSYSSSVTKALQQLIAVAAEEGTHIHLKILESRPRFDGVAFVKDLFKTPIIQHDGDHGLRHLKVDILSDACVALAAKHCDFVVIGSDKLDAEGDVSNKIGSLPACLMAKTLHPKSQVVVIATTDKITTSTKEELDEDPKDYATSEMVDSYPQEMKAVVQGGGLQGAKVRVRNPYFEWVPAKWVDVYVTEEGLMDLARLKDYANEKAELEDKLFGDL